MQKNIDRLMDLVKRTGDKMIIVSKEDGEVAWVLMSLGDYEKLIKNQEKTEEYNDDLTIYKEGDKIEKINEDIAVWREKENSDDPPFILEDEIKKKEDETESQFYFEPVE